VTIRTSSKNLQPCLQYEIKSTDEPKVTELHFQEKKAPELHIPTALPERILEKNSVIIFEKLDTKNSHNSTMYPSPNNKTLENNEKISDESIIEIKNPEKR
jgi:hypothetical protein